MQENFVADRETFEHFLFEQKAAEIMPLAEYNGIPAGYALFFTSFSTFLGRPGIYLEDLYIKPEYRGRGMGKAGAFPFGQPQGAVVKEYLATLIRTLHRERVFALILAVVSLIFLGAVGFALSEPGEGTWLERFGRGPGGPWSP